MNFNNFVDEVLVPSPLSAPATKYSSGRYEKRERGLIIRVKRLFSDCRASDGGLEREMGFEPTTLCLGSRCSTTELLPPGGINL